MILNLFPWLPFVLSNLVPQPTIQMFFLGTVPEKAFPWVYLEYFDLTIQNRFILTLCINYIQFCLPKNSAYDWPHCLTDPFFAFGVYLLTVSDLEFLVPLSVTLKVLVALLALKYDPNTNTKGGRCTQGSSNTVKLHFCEYKWNRMYRVESFSYKRGCEPTRRGTHI